MNMNVSQRYIWGGGVAVIIASGLIIGAIRPNKQAQAAQPGSVPDVQVVPVQQQDVPIVGEWIGTFDGLVNADVRAQVTGYLLKWGYQEGGLVKKGQLLFQIDPRPFHAVLDQAGGQMAQAKAQLANAEAVHWGHSRCRSSPVQFPFLKLSGAERSTG
jgi:membrane fusion protein (multidrug efflux system)